MNFFAKTISSFRGERIPYTFQDKILSPHDTFPNNQLIWTIHKGINPKTSSPVTIFEFAFNDPLTARYEELARNCFHKTKLIRFPGIISVVDFIENDVGLFIVTEPVIPLLSYLKQADKGISDDSKLYGIYSIARTIEFININCNYLHGGLNLFSSIYVTDAGSWRLFGFELATNLSSDPNQPIYRLSSGYPGFKDVIPPEVQFGDIDSIRSSPTKIDSYKFAAFIYILMGNNTFDKVTSGQVSHQKLNALKLPRGILTAFKRIANEKISARFTIQKFLKETESYFERNPLIQFDKKLDETRYKTNEENIELFQNEVIPILDHDEIKDFPPRYLEYRVLPELIKPFHQLEKLANGTANRDLQGRILNHLLKFSNGLKESEFRKLCLPIIIQAFSIPDRAIRLNLLSQLPSYSKFLTESDVQLKLFSDLISGFQDSNFVIRETTLTSITEVIDKVSIKQVNQELLRILARSQMDPKPSIRVNTLVLIIKISNKINKSSRNTVLISALSKSLRDTFTPCKLTALSGFESLIEVFSLDEICGKILGILAISLMDSRSKKVRDEARRIFNLFLEAVENHGSTLGETENDDEEEEREFYKKHAPNTEPAEVEKKVEVESSNEWSLSGGLLKLAFSSGVEGDLNKTYNSSNPDLTEKPPILEGANHVSSPIPVVSQASPMGLKNVPSANDFDIGWDLDDFETADDPQPPQPKPASTKSSNQLKSSSRRLNKPTSSLKLGGKVSLKSAPPTKLNLVEEEDNWDGEW